MCGWCSRGCLPCTDRSTHGVEEASAGEGLDQAGDGAGTLGGFARGWLIMGRDEDDGLPHTAFQQPLPQLKPGQAGQLDVEDEANSAGGGVGLQERLRRGENPGQETACLQESL